MFKRNRKRTLSMSTRIRTEDGKLGDFPFMIQTSRNPDLPKGNSEPKPDNWLPHSLKIKIGQKAT